MTKQEIERIQQEIANKTPSELIEAASAGRNLLERIKRLKKLRKYK